MSCAAISAGRSRRCKTSGSLTRGQGKTATTCSTKTSARTGATKSTGRKRQRDFPPPGWKKCGRPLKRSKEALQRKRAVKKKQPARKSLRTGCISRVTLLWNCLIIVLDQDKNFRFCIPCLRRKYYGKHYCIITHDSKGLLMGCSF